MKTLIGTTTLAVAFAWCPMVSAQSPDQTPATLQWNRIALEAVEKAKPNQHQAIRLMTVLSLAQYSALAGSTSEASRDETVAAASMQVISSLLPSQSAFVEERYRALLPGVSIGRSGLAQRVLAAASDDGFARTWSGPAPQASYAWRSLANPPTAPAYPAIGTMHTYFLGSGGEVRAPQPPALGSERFLADLAEVRRHTDAPTAETTRIAKFYDMTTGSLVAGYWNERAVTLVRESALEEPRAAGILATMNAAMMDAVVACHESKYAYWVPRPSQADPAIKPLIGVPNHPSYPSNHSCISTSAAGVLAHFFPGARADLDSAAQEAGLSRIYAGIHYRFDVDAGEQIGRNVVDAAIARHSGNLSKWASLGNASLAKKSEGVLATLAPAHDESLAMIVPAKGVQIYECRALKGSERKYEWAFVAPEADLFDTQGSLIGKHYAGPHWEANDGSKVVGAVKARADAPVAGAIPWLLLGATSVGNGGAFSNVTSIQRVATSGGQAPAGGCSQNALGATARMVYTADYYLFSGR